ncbi:MAG: PQQ-dependent sugar dehydrogenase, partial [Aquihabitans sp.]
MLTAVVGCSDSDSDDASAGGGSDTTEQAADDSGITMQDENLTAEVFISDLDQPTALALLPDGMLVIEKASGKVHLVQDGEMTGEAIDLAVNYFDERGLLGIALHPDFDSEPYVYLHWTWRGDGDGPDQLLGDDSDEATEVPALGNRVDRFLYQDGALTFDRNIVKFPSNTLDTDTSGNVRGNHDAGPLTFGPDGKLYAMMGDQNLRGQLQNISDGPPPDDEHFAGVILRLNDDGTVPEDNPFFDVGAEMGGEVGENIQAIYVYGVRNSFGLAFEPTSGALWQTENGDDSFDEINVFEAGDNSGWIQLM